MTPEHDSLRVEIPDLDDAPDAPHPVAARPARPAPAWARCGACGHAVVSSVPAFSAGSGIAARPFADDVYCHRCGLIGLPAIAPG